MWGMWTVSPFSGLYIAPQNPQLSCRLDKVTLRARVDSHACFSLPRATMASRGGGTSGSGGGGKVPESGGGGAPGAGKGSGRSGQRTNTHFPELGAVPGRMWRTAAGVEVVLGGGVAYEIQRELEANHFGRTVIAARAVRGPDGRFAASNDPNDLCCLKFTCVVRAGGG